MKFIVVDDRNSGHILSCRKAAKVAGLDLLQIDSINAGELYKQFQSLYTHFSTNSIEFELICFRRYFLLRMHLESDADLDKFVLIDSDLLLFRGVEKFIEKKIGENSSFKGSEITNDFFQTNQVSPHFSYWTRESIFDFTNFLVDFYKKLENISILSAIKTRFDLANKLGGVSDMTLLYLWANEREYKNNINEVYEGGMIDHNITIAHNFVVNEYQTKFGFKKMIFNSSIEGPIVFLANGTPIKCYAAHCQGKAKLIMGNVVDRQTVLIVLKIIAIRFARNVRSIFRSL